MQIIFKKLIFTDLSDQEMPFSKYAKDMQKIS